MKIVLATGIYPPSIGGPATYVRNLARLLTEKGCEVVVLTYDPVGKKPDGNLWMSEHDERGTAEHTWRVIQVRRTGGPLSRWMRYRKALRMFGKEADIVYAFSSISCGVPLILAALRGPRKLLRLGGDFLWERATDRGEEKGLSDWYASRPWFVEIMNGLLQRFDHVVFSTQFQSDLYDRVYRRLPPHSVIENALPAGEPSLHAKHDAFRLLYLGRFVAFKNLARLVDAMEELPDCLLTLVGSGPEREKLLSQAEFGEASDRITFFDPVDASQRQDMFREHDLLVIPSFTEISPNSALEARSSGLPVLLSQSTGLSSVLSSGMMLRPLRTVEEIVEAIDEARSQYTPLADRASMPLPQRNWEEVGDEHIRLFESLL